MLSTGLGNPYFSTFSSDHVVVSVAYALVSLAFTGLLAMIICISATVQNLVGNVKANIQDKKGMTSVGIFMKTATGKTITFDVEDLRGDIQIFMKTFSSAWFIADYHAHIQQESTFQLVLRLGGGMHVCTGETISLDVEASDTIGFQFVKANIQDKKGLTSVGIFVKTTAGKTITIDVVDLRGKIQIFMKTFSSAWYLADYHAHIQQESTFQLVLRLGGGMHICASKTISLDVEASVTIGFQLEDDRSMSFDGQDSHLSCGGLSFGALPACKYADICEDFGMQFKAEASDTFDIVQVNIQDSMPVLVKTLTGMQIFVKTL